MRCGAHWRQDGKGPAACSQRAAAGAAAPLGHGGDAFHVRVLARPRLNHPGHEGPVATAGRTHPSLPDLASIITAGGWCAPLCAGAPALQRPGAAKPQPSRFRPWLGFARPLNPASHMALHRPAAEPDVHQRQPGTDACQRRLDQAPRGYWPAFRPSAHRRTDALKRGEGLTS